MKADRDLERSRLGLILIDIAAAKSDALEIERREVAHWLNRGPLLGVGRRRLAELLRVDGKGRLGFGRQLDGELLLLNGKKGGGLEFARAPPGELAILRRQKRTGRRR